MNDTYKGFEICGKLSNHRVDYLDRILRFLAASTSQSKRCLVLRFDLRFPVGFTGDSTKCVSKFIDSLKAKLKAFENRKARLGQRVYKNNLKYLWVRENAGSDTDHFHFVITLNHDAFMAFGSYAGTNENMASRIYYAWNSALSLKNNETGLVHYCKNGVYKLDQNALDYEAQCKAVFFRLSYLAKKKTKVSSRRAIGFSQR